MVKNVFAASGTRRKQTVDQVAVSRPLSGACHEGHFCFCQPVHCVKECLTFQYFRINSTIFWDLFNVTRDWFEISVKLIWPIFYNLTSNEEIDIYARNQNMAFYEHVRWPLRWSIVLSKVTCDLFINLWERMRSDHAYDFFVCTHNLFRIIYYRFVSVAQEEK